MCEIETSIDLRPSEIKRFNASPFSSIAGLPESECDTSISKKLRSVLSSIFTQASFAVQSDAMCWALPSLKRDKYCYENNHLEDAAQALKDSFTGMSIDDLKIAVAAYYRIDAFSHDMVMSRQSLDTLLAITQNAGMLNGNTDYNKIVNTEIASRLGL